LLEFSIDVSVEEEKKLDVVWSSFRNEKLPRVEIKSIGKQLAQA
jgi:hypothetical protein